MPVSDWRVAFFRHAFLRLSPRRYALMLSPHEAQRLGQKYAERRGLIIDTMIERHLAGAITLAAPAADAKVLPLDIDAGGLVAIRTLIEAARRRDLWAFGQYCPRPGLAELVQRGYVWLVFAEVVEADRLQLLGEQLITARRGRGWKIEARATHAATRLPLARHTHTGRFGDLIIGDLITSIDQDGAGALAALHHAYH